MRVTVLLDSSVDLKRIASRKGHWSDWFDAHVIDTLKAAGHEVTPVQWRDDPQGVLADIRAGRPAVVFNLALSALDDRGRDAYPAALLEMAGLPYTGSPPRGLLLAADKALSKIILRAHGIEVPRFQVLERPADAVAPERYPVLVKALNRGGSESLAPSSLVTDLRSLRREARRVIEEYSCPVIAEEFIGGRELSVGILGGERPRVLTPGEWHFGSGPQFVTQRVKWDLPYSDRCGIRFAAAELSPALARQVREVCRRTYALLGLRDYGSVDLRITADGRVVVLEANANPGLFPGSLRFKAVPFPKLIAGIVRAARRRGGA